MDKESAKKLIRNTFQNSFNKKDFIYFIKNLLNQLTYMVAIYQIALKITLKVMNELELTQTQKGKKLTFSSFI